MASKKIKKWEETWENPKLPFVSHEKHDRVNNDEEVADFMLPSRMDWWAGLIILPRKLMKGDKK